MKTIIRYIIFVVLTSLSLNILAEWFDCSDYSRDNDINKNPYTATVEQMNSHRKCLYFTKNYPHSTQKDFEKWDTKTRAKFFEKSKGKRLADTFNFYIAIEKYGLVDGLKKIKKFMYARSSGGKKLFKEVKKYLTAISLDNIKQKSHEISKALPESLDFIIFLDN
jgi:hypothetical protein